MTATRRIGTQTSDTRDVILNSAEALIVEAGYPAVTYRKVAAKADVTSGLVQYYFPALDDLFVACIRRANERNIRHLIKALAARPDEPLRVLWEYSRDEAVTAMMLEFSALGNHRASVRNEITEATNHVREVQLEAVVNFRNRTGAGAGADDASAVLLFLMTGLPKIIQLEKGVGVAVGHDAILALVEDFLDSGEWNMPVFS